LGLFGMNLPLSMRANVLLVFLSGYGIVQQVVLHTKRIG